jgi:AraC family transcriptional regulator of adaptative response/methylated-DNA-[protein]-cysteine methyltransferase
MQPRPHSDAFNHDLMAAALRYLETHRLEQPDLETVAAHVGLSPTHFQRLFSRWVGVSPKRYLQHLALGTARRLLAERESVLETAHAAGLSGPSRLHDLFIRWEAMTPGDYARRGAGLRIAWGRFPSPLGEIVATGTERGLCGLAFAEEIGADAALADLAARWPDAAFREDPAAIAPWVSAAIGRRGRVALAPMGGPFQIKVWQALLEIPDGQVASYSGIARAVGSPRAVRAVGTAVGRNPVAWLIPCHRALRRDGTLGGYHWGLGVKRRLLALEAARAED